MDKIKEAALGYYNNSSREERDSMAETFHSMDEDKNGKISKVEFLKLMDKVMPTSEKMCLFAEIDEDRSGSLEFHQFITYFYIINYRPICDCCSGLVEELYYCCVRCWKKHKSNGHKLFQVCTGCYSRNLFKHKHDHAKFKDNHALFQANETSALKREKTVKEKQMEAALNEGCLYYRELMGTDRNVAYNLFRAMDRNGDGEVSVNEVIAFMTERGMPNADTRKVFEGMGLAGIHYRSIEDVVAFGYIFMVRPSCDRCRSIIFDMYYTCVACHDLWTNGQGAVTYDLCPVCFSSRDFLHQHSPFKQMMQSTTGSGGQCTENGGLQGMSRSFQGGEKGEGTQKSSKQKMQQILAKFSAVRTAAGAYITAHGGIAHSAATVDCNIM